MNPEALDQWRWEQADKDADKCGLEPDTIGRHFFIFEVYRRLVREDVRPEVDKGVGSSDTLAAKPETAEPVADEIFAKLVGHVKYAAKIINDPDDEDIDTVAENAVARILRDAALYTHPQQTEVVEALGKADAAIREMFRYYDGGETRGSYDGKPERAQLRKAGYATTKALAALKGSHT